MEKKDRRHFEKVPLEGIFRLKVYRSGVLVEEHEDSNLIVNEARIQMACLVAGEGAGRHIAGIAFGTNGTLPNAADKTITNQYARPVEGFSYPAMGQVQFDWQLPVTENNGLAILEFGLLTEDGTLFARRVRSVPINKEADISLEGQWVIIF